MGPIGIRIQIQNQKTTFVSTSHREAPMSNSYWDFCNTGSTTDRAVETEEGRGLFGQSWGGDGELEGMPDGADTSVGYYQDPTLPMDGEQQELWQQATEAPPTVGTAPTTNQPLSTAGTTANHPQHHTTHAQESDHQQHQWSSSQLPPMASISPAGRAPCGAGRAPAQPNDAQPPHHPSHIQQQEGHQQMHEQAVNTDTYGIDQETQTQPMFSASIVRRREIRNTTMSGRTVSASNNQDRISEGCSAGFHDVMFASTMPVSFLLGFCSHCHLSSLTGTRHMVCVQTVRSTTSSACSYALKDACLGLAVTSPTSCHTS